MNLQNYFKLLMLIALFSLFACNNDKPKEEMKKEVLKEVQTNDKPGYLSNQVINEAVKMVYEKYNGDKEKIQKGITQTASLWKKSDGTGEDFKQFCIENYINDEQELEAFFNRLSHNFEVLNGNFHRISVELQKPLHLRGKSLLPIDYAFGAFSPSAHFDEDMYQNKIAFMISLNFPTYSLSEKEKNANSFTRKQWAYARIGDMFTSREPAEIKQEYSKATTNADAYISEYNIFMGNLFDDKAESYFDKNLKLISHWGLRDELKSNYNVKDGLDKQKMIYAVMDKIITQEIPQPVINSGDYFWNPYTNKLKDKDGKPVNADKEPNTRYNHLLNVFNAVKSSDPYYPGYENYIQRNFDSQMEISVDDITQLFIDYVSSSTVKEVAKLIEQRLDRELEPFDIWYNGFSSGNALNEKELDKITRTKYPTVESFENDLPQLLQKLNFNPERAYDICKKIKVEAARGAGHAWGAEMKSDVSLLRTRIAETGMNYKGYNIAIHEFGHNVEQTISLHDVDYYMLHGVPNTGFTEALAFVFQSRDLDLLGLEMNNNDAKNLSALDDFWSTYEIMGVSLVDIYVWRWLYKNPNATAEELKVAVINIAKEVWNKYYAEVFGVKDQPILAIYSHMIDAPLYLSAYPVGLLIKFQLEEQLQGKNFADEVQRIYKLGRITPNAWMKEAVGSELSAKPMLRAAEKAVKSMSKKEI